MATFTGTAGNDSIAGSTSADIINGAAGNDTLAGGAGADSIQGGQGDDLITWRGDILNNDGADTIDGGQGSDTLAYTTSFGGASTAVSTIAAVSGHVSIASFNQGTVNAVGVETLTIRATNNGADLKVTDLSTTDVRTINFDFTTTTGAVDTASQTLSIFGGASSDTVTATISADGSHLQVAGLAGVTSNITVGANDSITLGLGAGDDTFVASGGALAGHLTVNGSAGNDSIVASGGNDVIQWDSQFGGADTVEGGAGSDTELFNLNGSITSSITASGDHVLATSSGVTTNLHGVETLTLQSLDGGDTITLHDLTATDVRTVNINLIGGTSTAAGDLVTLPGAPAGGAATVTISSDGTSEQVVYTLNGAVVETVNITGIRSVDRIDVGDVFTGTSGNDTITPTLVSAGVVASGAPMPGAENDTINAGAGNDFLAAGGGHNQIFAGEGDDTIVVQGSDFVDGGAGSDLAIFGGTGAADTLSLSAVGGNVAAALNGVTSTLVNVEKVQVGLLDGADSISASDLLSTSVRELDISLASGTTGGADGVADTVSLTGSASAEGFQIFVGQSGATIFEGTGAGADLETDISFVDSADVLSINGGAGDDTLQVEGGIGVAQLAVDGGAGNDLIADQFGGHTLNGGSGNDTISDGGVGVIHGGDDNDVISGFGSLNGDAGNDTITSSIAATVDGGAGNDSIVSTLAGDTLGGGGGNDTISSTFTKLNGGAESISGGDGDDLIRWTTQTSINSKLTIDGGAGDDTLFVSGTDLIPSSSGAPIFLSLGAGANGHAALSASEASNDTLFNSYSMDLSNLETVHLSGSPCVLNFFTIFVFDEFHIGDLTGTGLKLVDVDLAAPVSSAKPDGFVDQVFLTAAATGSNIVASTAAGSDQVTVTGLGAAVTIEHFDSFDTVLLSGGAGNDILNVSAADHFAKLDGMAGNDSIAGGVGTFTIIGGDGDDTLSSSGGHTTDFVISSSFSGQDVIADFHTHQAFGAVGDRIDLSDAVDHNFTDLISRGHLVQSGADTLITDGTHVLAVLRNVDWHTLSAVDFAF